MRLAISTDSLHGYGLDRIFEIAKKLGFDGIDLKQDKKEYDTTNAEYLNELQKEHSLPILSIQASDKANSKDILATVELAKAIQTKIVIIQPPKLFDRSYINWLRKNVPKLRKENDISIALENNSSAGFLGILPERAMSNTMELKRFRHVCLDVSRAADKKQDIIKMYNTLKEYVVALHLSDYKNGVNYLPLTKGDLALESLLIKLKDGNFKGILSLKINPKRLGGNDEAKVQKNLKEMLTFCKKFIG